MINNILFSAAASTNSSSAIPIPLPGVIALISSFFIGTLIVSKLSVRLGVPSILGVLLFGIMFDADTVGKFLTPQMIETLHTSSLSLLLFYAGLSINFSQLTGLVGFSLMLAVGGVIVSSLAFTLAVWLIATGSHALIPGIPSLPLSVCFMVAACVGTTDAGATANVLRSVDKLVPERVKRVIQFESALNDPAAILFLSASAGLFIALQSPDAQPVAVFAKQIQIFLRSVGSGIMCGLILVYISQFILKKVLISRDQVLVLGISIAMAAFGFTTLIGGSGFVASFVTGAFLANNIYNNPHLTPELIEDSLEPFNTLMELTVFLLFGLLFNPVHLLNYWLPGVLMALVLMLIIRPLSVVVFQKLSPLSKRETALVSWCGLRGAVPFALAYTVLHELPMITGLSGEPLLLISSYAQTLVFVIVILNLSLQGFTLPHVCRWLGFKPLPSG